MYKWPETWTPTVINFFLKTNRLSITSFNAKKLVLITEAPIYKCFLDNHWNTAVFIKKSCPWSLVQLIISMITMKVQTKVNMLSPLLGCISRSILLNFTINLIPITL